VSSCLLLLPPLQFLQLLWSELSLAASLGELETCRRLGTFVLTAPSTPPSPPLLPIFLHVLVPSLITSLDAAAHPPGPEQTLHVELLVALISSSLTRALHLDYALRAQADHPAQALSMARKLAGDLRARRASRQGVTAAAAIWGRLCASQAFVGSFPMFT
jgi:mediator of RNA polymerase II transcription subunit 5